VDEAALDALAARSARLIACYGNNDGPALRRRLPEIAYAEVDGLRLAVVHETGPSTGRNERCEARFPDVGLVIFGHSHIPWGHDHRIRPALAESRLPYRSPPPALRHVHDRHRAERRLDRGNAAQHPTLIVRGWG
jgi:hypothetical protein